MSDSEESESQQDDPVNQTEGKDESDLDERYWPLPAEVKIDLTVSYGSKSVSAFAFNNSGTRFAAGSYDYDIKIWDFDKPGVSCTAQPCGQTVIKNLDHSSNDELILVVPAGCQAVITGKDGILSKQCPKGDQYITDMRHTKGHVRMLNDGCWNPKDKATFITSSDDGTIRIWDLNKLTQQLNVVKVASAQRIAPNACKYTRDALAIAAGYDDGSIKMWDTRRNFYMPSVRIDRAHQKQNVITGLDMSYGLNKMCTRSEDGSCKLWDLRKPKDALASRSDIDTSYTNSDCTFSPNDELILVGIANPDKTDSGQLLALDATCGLATKTVIDTDEGSILRVKWHPKINHIGYSTSKGSLAIAYDRRKSLRGFTNLSEGAQPAFKRKSQPSNEEGMSNKKIFTPNALPLFRDDPRDGQSSKASTYKPEAPVNKVKPVGSTLSSFVAQRIAKRRA